MQEQNLPTPTPGENESANKPESTSPEKPKGQSLETNPIFFGQEKAPDTSETANQSAPASVINTTSLPQPITLPVGDPNDSSQTSQLPTNIPVVADDVDVIEKVWVSKAKDIVAKTKDDPYQQEKQVSELQTDYQNKRFEKEPQNSS